MATKYLPKSVRISPRLEFIEYPEEYLIPAMRRIYSIVYYNLPPGFGWMSTLDVIDCELRLWIDRTKSYLKLKTRSSEFEKEQTAIEDNIIECVDGIAHEGGCKWSRQARIELEASIYQHLEWICAELERLRPGTAPSRVCYMRSWRCRRMI